MTNNLNKHYDATRLFADFAYDAELISIYKRNTRRTLEPEQEAMAF